MLRQLDLRGTPCPTNFVRCSLALEKLNSTDYLQVDLDRGEPEEMVLEGLKNQGYLIKIIIEENTWIRLLIVPNEV